MFDAEAIARALYWRSLSADRDGKINDMAAELRAAYAAGREAERARIAAAVQALAYDDAELRARDNGDEHYASAGYDQAIGHVLDVLAPTPPPPPPHTTAP